ncbi:LCP family protein [Nesterenkonia sp. F]|uniref:LCP family protein n=1 Tax=Nesterenkonia sp. F TaxID=795955 RepID=UPI000255CB76|nr:LCP family protein [Nesterenkonia sp. F]
MSETPAPAAAPRRRRRRRITAVVLISLLVLVVGGLATAWYYLDSLSSSYEENVQTFEQQAREQGEGAETGETFPEESDRPAKDSDDESINILLLGSDDRAGTDLEQSTGQFPGSRSDTMMLVHVPSDRSGVQVMSIPRDLWVDVPGEHGEAKINAPLALGGVSLTIQTIEGLFDVRVDHVASVDMEGFIGLVETLDGVEVDSTYPEAFTTTGGRTFRPGTQHMDADEALAFVRERKSFPDGDLQRARNQQSFIRAVVDESLQAGTLANPGRVRDMVETFTPYLTVDESLDASTVASLGWEIRGAADDITMFTLPTGPDGRSADGQWIWQQDEQAMAEISDALADDTLEEYVEENDL